MNAPSILRNHYGAILAADGTFIAVMVDAAGNRINLDEGFPTEKAAEAFAEAIYRQDLETFEQTHRGDKTASLLVEGVAVTLFLATFGLWVGVFAGRI